MKVSIIIPVYNLEKYIGATIESCLNQSYRDIEVIVVNDGSTDNSAEVIRPFLSDERIKYFEQINSGVSRARNLGIKQSTGEYITFLDGDDFLSIDTIEKNIKLIESKKVTIDWLIFPIIRTDAAGNEITDIAKDMLSSYKHKDVEMLSAKETFVAYRNGRIPPIVCSMMFSRSFFIAEFVDGRYEDTYMFLELLTMNPTVLISPYGSYLYVNREGSFINQQFTHQKWIDYTRSRLQYIKVGRLLMPKNEKEYQRMESSIYYSLRYLRFKKRNDKEFAKPLAYFKSQCPNINFDFKLWFEMVLKSFISLFRNER